MQLSISGIREETPQVKTFYLEAIHGDPLIYNAGQFLTFLLHGIGKEQRRSYSLSSTPDIDEPLAITVKRVDNGRYSRWLIDEAKVGDRMNCIGATGLFTLPSDIKAYRQIFLFAAGIGITPLFSLLKAILYQHADIRVVLIYSNRNRTEAVFYEEIRNLEKEFKERLKVEWLFSEAKHLSRARMSKALFPQLIAEYLTADPKEVLCFTCGPLDYMWIVTLLLEETGVPKGQIRKEIFVSDRQVEKMTPPDTSLHSVFIALNGSKIHLATQYPQSILQAAKTQGIALPYSCETGQCGSCAAKCVSGEIWMSYNEVLTDKDMLEGKILTCVGYPINGDAEISYQ